MSKDLKKPKLSEKILKYKKALGIGLLSIAATIGIGRTYIDDPVTLGIVSDRADDKLENGVPLYSDPNTSKLVTVLPDGALIISNDKITNSSNQVLKVSALNEKSEKVNGYVPSKYVENSILIHSKSELYKVNEEKGVPLRRSPRVKDDNKIGSIANGTIVIGKNNNNNWTHVVIFTKQSLQTGFVSSQCLQALDKTAYGIAKSPQKNSFINSVDTSKQVKIPQREVKIDSSIQKGQVFGIDIHDIPPQLLEQILTGKVKIPEKVRTNTGANIDFSALNNKVPRFVYIKLLGSTILNTNITKGKDTPYKELSAVCEKLKVPYGFYYYSTCITEDEAKQEYQWISEYMKKLGPRKYNLLPLSLDVEIYDNRDRQFRVSKSDLTNSKIALANMVENEFGKTIIYTSGNTCNSILDIEQYQKGLNSGNSGVWFVSPPYSPAHMKAYEKVKRHVFSRQIALGASLGISVPEGMKEPLIDINIFNEKDFKECIEGKYQNRSLTYAARNSKKAVASIENER